MNYLHTLFAILLFGFANTGHSETVKVTMKNIRSSKGSIAIGLYTSNSTFQDEKPYKQYIIKKTALRAGILNYSIELPVGSYGIALLDDENGNAEMDYNFIGIPTEGYGFSDYVHSGMFKPTFNDFKFHVKKGAVTRVMIDVDYF